MDNADPIQPRREFFRTVAAVIAAAQLGTSGSAIAQARPSSPRKPGPSEFGPLRSIDAGDLGVSYVDMGPKAGPAVLLLHGWPYDIYSFEEVAPALAREGHRVIVPFLRGYGPTHFLSAKTPRNGQPTALANDAVTLMDALNIKTAVLAGFDWGGRSADIVATLWPVRCKALVSVSGYLIGSQAANKVPLRPQAELAWWYQFYFATERGREGYDKFRRDFTKLILQLASPNWKFSPATFERTAASFDNSDHVSIMIQSYRWRLGLVPGEPRFDALEAKLASFPAIGVPTITMEGDANGAPHPEANSYRNKFTGKYEHRISKGGIGHNLPQEAPHDFVQAILDVQK